MDLPGQDEDRQPLTDDRITVSAAFEGSEKIATARILARQFLLDLRGPPCNQRYISPIA
jgi:hypothetical protein